MGQRDEDAHFLSKQPRAPSEDVAVEVRKLPFADETFITTSWGRPRRPLASTPLLRALLIVGQTVSHQNHHAQKG